MAEFIKMNGNRLDFKLMNVNYEEDFALWDTINRKFLRELNP